MIASKHIIAKTFDYKLDCNQNHFRNSPINTHRATIGWVSAFGDEAQAPRDIQLCVGGEVFTYRVVEEE